MIKKEVLSVKRIDKNAVLPNYALSGDVGLDLVSVEDISLFPMEQKLVRTGIQIKIPEGYVGLIRDRAGIVSKMNVHTAAGTFDPDYRGEISIMLVNFSEEEVEIEKGMKIAQLIVVPVVKVQVKEVKTLDKTQRGEKGFGSTGIKEKLALLKKLDKIK
jgi:dUTP pyrophosphatase